MTPPFPSDPAHPSHRFPPPGCGWVKVVDDSPCPKAVGHEDPHRCHSPYGDGRWVEYDVVTEAEVHRSLSWLRSDPELLERGWSRTYNRRLHVEVLVPPATVGARLAAGGSLTVGPDGLEPGCVVDCGAPADTFQVDTFRCPRCGTTSAHPMDKRFGYCGACREFTGTPTDFIVTGRMSSEEQAAWDERATEAARHAIASRSRPLRLQERLRAARMTVEADVRRGNLEVILKESGHTPEYVAAELAKHDAKVEAEAEPVTVPSGPGRWVTDGDVVLPLGPAQARRLAVDVAQAAARGAGVLVGEDIAAVRRAVEEVLVDRGIIAGPTKPLGGPPDGNAYDRPADLHRLDGSSEVPLTVAGAVARELDRQVQANNRRRDAAGLRPSEWDAAALARAALDAQVSIDTADGSLRASVAAGRHDEAFALLSAVDGVKATGGAVEIAGVRIEPCDDHGRTATTRAYQAALEAATPCRCDQRTEESMRVCQLHGDGAADVKADGGAPPVDPAYVEGQLLLDSDGDPIAMAVSRSWAGVLGRWRDDAALLRFLDHHAARTLAAAWSAALEDAAAPHDVATAAHRILGLGDVELVEGGGYR